MSIRNLDRVLAPRSVAVIGATRRPRAVGNLVLANMRTAGFAGRLMPVNPNETEIDGLPVFASVAALPEPPDLAVIATPPDHHIGPAKSSPNLASFATRIDRCRDQVRRQLTLSPCGSVGKFNS